MNVGHLDLSENIQWAMEHDESFIAVVTALIERFTRNDWCDVDADRQVTNDRNAASSGAVIGNYLLSDRDDPIWIVAWPGHRHTTVMYRSDDSIT